MSFSRLAEAGLMLVAAIFLLEPPAARATTFTVTTNSDSGVGSLRFAIQSANSNAGPHTINFNLTGAGPFTISPASPLPILTSAITVDGYSQTNASTNTLATGNNAVLKIRLDGTSAGAGANAFKINGGGCAVRGFSIINFNGDAILLQSLSSTAIQGNFIGLDVDGVTVHGNTGRGILIQNDSGDTIGGVGTGQRNVISGNQGGGILISNGPNNQILGNYVGTDASGTLPRGNRGPALTLQNPTAMNNTIGGANAAARNIFSASTGSVTNDFGIVLNNCSANIIRGNFIGTDVTGTNALGNGSGGILSSNTVGITIGGTNAGAGNIIGFNTNAGVRLIATTNNAVLGNSIFSNTAFGIDIGPANLTTNDVRDVDNLQNFPVISSVVSSNGTLAILGTLNSKTNSTFRIEFFSNPACDVSGNGEGRTFLGASSVTTDTNGNANLNFVGANLIPGDQVITATATGTNGTSEFSACQTIAFLPMITIQPTSQAVAPGSNVTFTVAATNGPILGYQWLRNGMPLADATNAMLVINPVLTSDAGDYLVVVSNAVGAVVSSNATLTVLGPALITMQPMPQSVLLGSNVLLSVTPNGTPPVFYQWRVNGVNIPGATNSTLPLTNFQLTNAGLYSVAVYNALGVTNSDAVLVSAPLSELAMTDNFTVPVNLTAPSGSGHASNALATVEAGEPQHAGKPGGKSLWISWQAPATGIATVSTAGSTFDTLLAVYTGNSVSNLVPVAADDDRGGFFRSQVSFNVDALSVYRIAVDGLGGASGDVVLSWSLETTPDSLPVILTQPTSQTVAAGGTVSFTVGVVGAGLGYQWLFNGTNLAGATNNQLLLTNVGPTNVGSYTVQVTRATRTIQSQPALLQVNQTGELVETVQASDKFLDVIFANNPLRLDGPPAFDAVALAAVSRGYSGSQVFSTSGATKEPGEPNHCGIAGGASHWFSYFADATGVMFMNTEGSTFDTVLAVYTGPGIDLASLTPVACNNNRDSNVLTSSLSFNAQSNSIYYIAVDGVAAATGVVQLNYSLVIPSRVTELGQNVAGANRVRVTGQAGGKFTLQVSSNLTSWSSLITTNLGAGTLDYTDLGSSNLSPRFYRANGQP